MELHDLLKHLKDLGGSDLHIVAGLPPAVRVFDELTPLRDVPRLTPDEVREMIYPILAKEEIELFEKNPDRRYELDFARGIADLGRFRFNLHKQRGSLAVAIRALSNDIPSLYSLGLPKVVGDFANVRKGLVLVTGPASSGRSTTLAAMINEINHQRPARIMTIEDPVEYIIQSNRSYVTQREVGDGADTLSFENALRYTHRQDLEVVMVSSLRGYETMRRVLELAEQGLLVLASMSTVSATQTLSRFIECFPPEQQSQAISQLSANLIGVVSQLLLPKMDRKGRVLACEVMKVNALVRSEIRQNKFDNLYSAMQTDTSDEMQTMDNSLLELTRNKLIDYSTARPFIRDEATHRAIYHLSGGPKQGTPLPSSIIKQTEQHPNAKSPTPSSQDSAVRRRLGSTVIPPWEKEKK